MPTGNLEIPANPATCSGQSADYSVLFRREVAIFGKGADRSR
jgi:hypothetical protein